VGQSNAHGGPAVRLHGRGAGQQWGGGCPAAAGAVAERSYGADSDAGFLYPERLVTVVACCCQTGLWLLDRFVEAAAAALGESACYRHSLHRGR
jgi:hypothetical protein